MKLVTNTQVALVTGIQCLMIAAAALDLHRLQSRFLKRLANNIAIDSFSTEQASLKAQYHAQVKAEREAFEAELKKLRVIGPNPYLDC